MLGKVIYSSLDEANRVYITSATLTDMLGDDHFDQVGHLPVVPIYLVCSGSSWSPSLFSVVTRVARIPLDSPTLIATIHV
jgi:hypothetical protein